MRYAATLAFVLGSSSMALADAPGGDGDYDGDYGGPSSVTPTYATPAPVAPVAYSCAPTAVDVMATRWAIGLNFGSMSVAPENDPENAADFSVAELSLRYRATYHLELELALTGGRQMLEDGEDGPLAFGGGTLGLRYRFSPSQRWNWWLMAGVGQTTIAQHDSTKQEREQLAKPHGQLGIGIERRFQRFAIQAELRMTSIGDKKDDNEVVMPPVRPPMTGGVETDPNGQPTKDTPPDPIDQPLPVSNNAKLNGGVFTIGLSYYF